MKKIHPLHTFDMIDMHTRCTGMYFDQDRCTGRTTALTLELIAKAIRNPYIAISIRDHHDSTDAHRRLAKLIYCKCVMLRLNHMAINVDKLTITFGG